MAPKRSEGLEEMTNAFLACRDKGHHWRHLNDQVTASSGKRILEVSRWYQCPGCSTEMSEVFEIPSCEVKRRTYVYPDGYLLTKDALGGSRLSVRDVRRQVFNRNGIKF